jgi:predicted kinase
VANPAEVSNPAVGSIRPVAVASSEVIATANADRSSTGSPRLERVRLGQYWLLRLGSCRVTHHRSWYTRGMRPLLVVVTGLPGTGKSTVAENAADVLGAPVLSHDWAISGLRPFPTLQHALDSMEPPGHRAVGWSILCALARSQLRRSSSVILDGVARAPEIERFDQVAHDEGARLIVLLTECADIEVHRSRIEGRHRAIPDWYELDWDHVQRARRSWVTPARVDLSLQATNARHVNSRMVGDLLATIESGESSPIGEE